MSKKLKAAIEADDAGAVREAVKGMKDLNRKLPGAGKPVVHACRLGKAAALEALLEAGATPAGEETYVGFSLFVIAAEAGHLAVMEVLFRRGAASPEQIEHAVETTALRGQVASLRWILTHCKPPVTTKAVRMGLIPRNPEVVELLLTHGGDVHGREDLNLDRGMGLIHSAATGLEEQNIEVLVRLGADINMRDGRGRTPLMHAAAAVLEAPFLERGGHPVRPAKTLALMVKLGADGRMKDEDGNDALVHYLWDCRGEGEEADSKIVKLLKQAGATGDDARMKMWEALGANDVKGLKKAIVAGADVNGVSPDGGTPLMWRADDRPELVEILLAAGADPNKATRAGLPLVTAARGGRLETVKRLLAAGADLHALEPARTEAEAAHPTNAYAAAEIARATAVLDYLRSLGARRPVARRWKPLEPGVGSWNDFSEVLVKASAVRVGEALAEIMGGTVRSVAYGEVVSPGARAYVAAQPRGMPWGNLFQVRPERRRFGEHDVALLRQLAAASGATVLTVDYSDTADAAEIQWFEPGGEERRDAGVDREMLEEMVGALGKEAPSWAKKAMKETPEGAPGSVERLEALAAEERFVVGALGLRAEEGQPLEVGFPGYPEEAFEGVVFVST